VTSAIERVAIIGAGPCGLACARELERLGFAQWRIYERGAEAGGHAGSVRDPAGFTWDFGGHVVFSHYGEFDALLDEVMGDDVYEHERSSFVHFDGARVPYPFQNNLRYLGPELALECLVGLMEAPGGSPDGDFAAWMEATFGRGITRLFMRPYNVKVWATPLERMSATWIADRVSVVDFRRALRSVLLAEDDVGWGPNNTFKFPRRGGTGEIYRRLAASLGERVRFEREVTGIDAKQRLLRFADGSEEGYDALVSTMPIDRLVAALDRCPGRVGEAAASLEHTGVRVVGVGYEAPPGEGWSWMYFPDGSIPFYRVTNFAKYSPENVPGGDTGTYASFLTETSYSSHRPPPESGLEQAVTDGLAATGIAPAEANIASVHMMDAEYGYPVPTRGRDRALRTIQPWLVDRGIYSRGRFGSWRYEIGNMDHAVKMGIDVARRIVEGRAEEIWSP
jgi:UDP-galactopyranose mutase